MAASAKSFDEKYVLCRGCGTYQRKDRLMCPKCGCMLRCRDLCDADLRALDEVGLKTLGRLAADSVTAESVAAEEARRALASENRALQDERRRRIPGLMEPGEWYMLSQIRDMYGSRYGAVSSMHVMRLMESLSRKGDVVSDMVCMPGNCRSRRLWALATGPLGDVPREMPMEEVRSRVTAALEANGAMTLNDLRTVLDWNRARTERVMKHLADEGVVEKAYSPRTGDRSYITWRLIDAEEDG